MKTIQFKNLRYSDLSDHNVLFTSRSMIQIHGRDLRVRSFGVMWIRISDPRSLGSWCIKGTKESTLITDSSVPLMHHDPSDLGSLILMSPKELTLRIIRNDEGFFLSCGFAALADDYHSNDETDGNSPQHSDHYSYNDDHAVGGL